MSTMIGLIGDPHAAPGPLAEALDLFRRRGVEHIICVGDIVGYGDRPEECVALLQAAGCSSVLGNHEVWYLQRHSHDPGHAAADRHDPVSDYIQGLPLSLELTIEGVSIYVVHASPPDSYEGGIRLLDEHGAIIPQQLQAWSHRLADFGHEVLVVGHTHQIFVQRMGDTLVINPGSTQYNHSCALLTLPGLQVEIIALGGRRPLLSWNWGMNVGGQSG